MKLVRRGIFGNIYAHVLYFHFAHETTNLLCNSGLQLHKSQYQGFVTKIQRLLW